MNKTFRPSALFFLVLLLSFAVPVFAGPLDNCQEFVKYGVPSERGALLCRKGYALAHNPANKTPDWVAERLTKERAEAVMDRSNDFRPDPDLPAGERAELSDYKGSGFDRGHMAPAGDMRWDEQAMSESFYLSNMAPQVGVGMNRGIWKNLEEKVRAWAIKRGAFHHPRPVLDMCIAMVYAYRCDQEFPAQGCRAVFSGGIQGGDLPGTRGAVVSPA